MLKLIERIRKYKDRKFNDGTYLVYSMGKVGSSSVESSLMARLPHAVVFHAHFLSDKWLNEILPNEKEFFHGNIRIGRKIRNYLNENAEKKIRIITLVREPLIREMSGIFENWKAHYSDIDQVSIEELTQRINKSDFKFCFNWFDSEFKGFTGFDIYSRPFDKEKGYQIYHIGKYEILCLQLEKLKDIFSPAMQEFIGIKMGLITSNVGETKIGSKLYGALKREYQLPDEKIGLIYESKFMKHFYSSADIEKFIINWKNR